MSKQEEMPRIATAEEMAIFDEDTTQVVDEEVEEVEEKEETEEEVEETEDSTEDSEETKEEKEEEEGDEDIDPIFTATFEHLQESGYLDLPEDYEFSGKEDDFEEALRVSDERRRERVEEEVLETMPSDEGKALFDYLRNGGTDIQSFVKYHAPANFEELDPQDEDDAKSLMRMFYKEKGDLSDEEINDVVDNLGDKIYTKAEGFKTKLTQTKEEQKKQFLQAQKEEQKRVREYEQNFIKTLKGMRLPEEREQKVLENFNKVEFEDGSQALQYQVTLAQIQNNPEHYIQFLSLLSNYDPQKGLNYEEKTKQTKKTKSLRDRIKGAGNSGQSKMSGGKTTKDTDEGWGTIPSNLKFEG